MTVQTESQHGASALRVENTVDPLAPELLPGLTEPFRRATERVRSDEHPGVGLGLAIVHSIVRAHDGTLELAPGPAGGLVVTVRLPRAAHARDADATGAWSPDRVAYGPTAAKRRPSLR